MTITTDLTMHMKMVGRVFVLPVFFASAFLVHADQSMAGEAMVPETDSLIEQLKMKEPQGNAPEVRTRSFGGFRGVSLEGPAEPPSVDMHITFAFGSAELTGEAKTELKKLGKALVSNELMDYSFELAGHTDAVGSEQANMQLSMQRARSVRDYLVETFGIDGKRMQAKGYGETRLAVPQEPTNGKNRRVQIINLGAQ